MIVFVGGQLGQIPLIPVVVVVVDPVINGAADIREGGPAWDLMGKRVLHVSKEALLRGVVPAVASAGHGLPQSAVLKKLNKLHTGVVAALVTVKDRAFAQGNAMVFHQPLHSLQHEIHLKGLAKGVGQNVLRAGVQNGGEIAVRGIPLKRPANCSMCPVLPTIIGSLGK